MGELVEGVWHKTSLAKTNGKGHFVRTVSTFRGWVRQDGQPGADGRHFPAAAGRYRLVVSHACPWAHRTLVARALMGLEEAVAVDVVEPLMGEEGWCFAVAPTQPTPGSTYERLFGSTYLRELYVRADPQFTGRVTVPVLWDTVTATVVSNESADIMRMFATAFAQVGTRAGGLVEGYDLAAIEAANAQVLQVNQGVYRCGFAGSQEAYNEAIVKLFAALQSLDQRLAEHRFLLGQSPCEADWRLFTTLIRFDAVYVTHFKCNLRRLADFVHLPGYLRDLYQWPHVADTVHAVQIKDHYYRSHGHLNPSGIVPIGFATDLQAPPGRI